MFDEIFKRYEKEIFYYCRSLLNGDEQGAEDCTQEVFLTFYNKMDKLKLNADIRSWLYKMANFKVKKYLQKNKIHSSIDDIKEDVLVSDADIEGDFETKESLQNLTKDEIELLKDYYMGNKPHEKMGITLNALKLRVHKIKKKLNL